VGVLVWSESGTSSSEKIRKRSVRFTSIAIKKEAPARL